VGPDGAELDVANTKAVTNASKAAIALFSPLGSPGVANEVVVLTGKGVSSESDSQNNVVRVLGNSASTVVDDTS